MLTIQIICGMGIRLLIISSLKGVQMKTWIRILLIIIMVAGLNGSACSTTTPKVTATSLPSLMVPTTTSSPVAQSSFTSTAEFRFNPSCWLMKPLQEGNDIKGSFIYAYRATPEDNRVFAWDVSSLHEITLKVDPRLNIFEESYVSSDGSYIAKKSGKNLTLISRNDVQSFLLPNENVLIDSTHTLGGRILLVDLKSRDDNYREGVGLTDIYYILDPASSEITKHSVFLPNLEQELHHVWVIQYSPDMKYVLYKSMSKQQEAGVQFTLYDLEKNEVVWVGPSREFNLKNMAWTVPAWRPDSSALTNIYFSENESNYYSISLDGKVSQLTSFDGAWLYTTQSNLSWSGYREFPNWSPDGRYLVLSGTLKGEKDHGMGSSLYIWDNQEKVVYKPCLLEEDKRFLDPYFPHWSFDSSHFIVTLTFASEMSAPQPGKTPKSYILDLARKTIYELPNDNHMGEFISWEKKDFNEFLGWVNWEIP
jgi:hypothetical protein